ncbi:MAG: prkC 8 [Phycisphaerales bacterium]|nr:prkC 8 [Phycisphaerales bacterium]
MMMGALSDQGTDAAMMRGYRYKHGDRPLDGYTVQRAAGRGAFGEVYYAISDSGREVALKVVNAYEQVELRGIGQCMNLKSPHLVSVFDIRNGDHGQPVVIMEFVAGPSLRELLDESPSGFGAQKAAFFLREIGKGLTYLHDCGIVHRDLKPANIFYENGYVKIGDYGLSKAISASHRSAQTVTVGTLHYMAPEVGAGCYDRSVDIYALGALLYEMLTGQPPFFGVSPAEVLMKHLNAPVRLEGIEEPFATVLRRALAKDPAQRYQSVQEMVEGVFGAEHIRQSVSCFAPTSLTMVAGRVAHRIAGLGAGSNVAGVPLSSRAYDVVAEPNSEGRSGLVGHVVRRLRVAGQRLRVAVQRWAGPARGAAERLEAAQAMPLKPADGNPPVAPGGDPLLPRHRRLLAVIAAVAVAIAAGVFSDNNNPAMSIWFVILGTLGATLGLCWAAARVLPDLSGESRFVRHLATGGLAAAMVFVIAFPAWGPAVHSPGWSRAQSGHTLAAICVSLLLIDWTKRMSSGRRSRVLLGDLVVAGIVAVVFAGMFDAAPEVVIGVLCGTCMAVQIASPWIPRMGRSAAPASSSPASSQLSFVPPAPVLQSTRDNQSTHAISAARSSTGVPNVFQLARHCVAAGRFVVMSPIRLIFHLITFVLTAGAFVLATALAFDLPGWLASGRVNPRISHNIHREMGTENWPFVLRSLGSVGLFVTACLALIFVMWVRRSRGNTHLLRGVVGTAILLAAPFVLAHGRVEWGPMFEPMSNGWTAWQELVQGLTSGSALRTAVMLISAVMLLLWPPAAKPIAPVEQQTPATDKASSMTTGGRKIAPEATA